MNHQAGMMMLLVGVRLVYVCRGDDGRGMPGASIDAAADAGTVDPLTASCCLTQLQDVRMKTIFEHRRDGRQEQRVVVVVRRRGGCAFLPHSFAVEKKKKRRGRERRRFVSKVGQVFLLSLSPHKSLVPHFSLPAFDSAVVPLSSFA